MNQLKVSIQQSIIALVARGWSQRRIARELQLDRSTVARYAKGVAAKPATNPAPGSPPGSEAKPAISTAGSEATEEPKPANNLALGLRPGPPSLCEAFANEIKAAVQAGLSAQRTPSGGTANQACAQGRARSV